MSWETELTWVNAHTGTGSDYRKKSIIGTTWISSSPSTSLHPGSTPRMWGSSLLQKQARLARGILRGSPLNLLK